MKQMLNTTKIVSLKSGSISFQDAGMETCHQRCNVCFDSNFLANENDTEAYSTLILKKSILATLTFSCYFYGPVLISLPFCAVQY
jgi:hypothetical protein